MISQIGGHLDPGPMQHPEVAEEINSAAAAALHLRCSRPFLLGAGTVADVDVGNPRQHRLECLYRILPGAVDVAGIHVDPESWRANALHGSAGGRGVVDALAHVGFDAEFHPVFHRPFRHEGDQIGLALEVLILVTPAPGADVDHRDAQGRGGVIGPEQPFFVQGRLFHGQQLQFVFFGQFPDRWDLGGEIVPVEGARTSP